MEMLVPCKLGEDFQTYKFSEWADNKRLYEKREVDKLLWVEKYACNTHCLSVPYIHTLNDHYQYDEELKNYEFDPKYIMVIPDYMFVDGILSDKGIDSKRVGHLWSLHHEDGKVMADFICKPHYEHIKFEYPLEIEYKPAEPRKREMYLMPPTRLSDYRWAYT